MSDYRFDFKDVFRAPRIALSVQRIWIQFLGFAVGYGAYVVLTYTSLILSGNELDKAWTRFGVFPCLFGQREVPWHAWLVFAGAIILFLVPYQIAATGVSRAAYKFLKGDHFYSWKDAYGFALKKAGSVLLSPVALVVLIALFIVGGLFVGLVGKIPYAGELGVALFSLVWIIASLFVVYFMVAFSVALILSPSVIATTEDDAFEAVFQSFSTLWSQPWRLVLYEALSGLLALVGFFLLAFMVKKAVVLTANIMFVPMGSEFWDFYSHALYLTQKWVYISQEWIGSLLGESSRYVYFVHRFNPLELVGTLKVSSYLMAVSLMFVGGLVVSYGLAILNVGHTLIYLNLRKIKDQENLLERKDADEEEEEDFDLNTADDEKAAEGDQAETGSSKGAEENEASGEDADRESDK